MATSFLQFCAMCEKQITVPNNSILYCSENCRRKDSCKPLTASLTLITAMSSSTTPSSSPPMSPRVIVAPMTPTRASSKSTLADLHDSKSDLDPSEWKPIIPTRNGGAVPLTSSEAWVYLSQFHGGDEAMMMSRRKHDSLTNLWMLSHGPGALPSLSHTPTSIASSYNSNSDYFPYDFASRPLLPRCNPSFSAGAFTTKGVELVMPHMSPSLVDDTGLNDYSPQRSGPWESGSITPPNGDILSLPYLARPNWKI